MRREEVSPETWLIVSGRPPAVPGEPLNTPIIAASTYSLGGERIYSRNEATEGWEAFEAMLGGLEGGGAVAFSSGMAACAAVLGQLPSGAHLVLSTTATRAWPESPRRASRHAGGGSSGSRPPTTAGRSARPARTCSGWSHPQIPCSRWLTSPGSVPLRADLRTCVVVDNTFATPLVQRPLELGADIVVHSATKLIGGHSDLLMGATVTADADALQRLRRARGLFGGTPGMLECFLALRGARTLALRLDHAQASAEQLAERLAGHPAVERVRYPGFGTIVSFELADADTADRACQNVRVIRHATSLGGVETSMERRNAHPGQEHIPPGLIRLSVGCESVDDTWRDLAVALDAAIS